VQKSTTQSQVSIIAKPGSDFLDPFDVLPIKMPLKSKELLQYCTCRQPPFLVHVCSTYLSLTSTNASQSCMQEPILDPCQSTQTIGQSQYDVLCYCSNNLTASPRLLVIRASSKIPCWYQLYTIHGTTKAILPFSNRRSSFTRSKA
jgi:hypothetical protein